MMPDPTRCCIYEIQEGTKNERVAVGSNGNILRWAPDGKDDQRWVIAAADDNHCRIETVSNREFMAVGWNGNILRWAETGGPEQLFSFINPTPDGWWNIQENTKQEYVAVGWDGNILRWAWSGHMDQRFRLIPINEKPAPIVSPGQYKPGQLPDIPRIETVGVPPPERSDYYLIGEVSIPATLVADPLYGDRVSQVQANPYYILRRQQYWDRGQDQYRGYYVDNNGANVNEQFTLKVGVSDTVTKSVESTLSFKLTASGSISLKLLNGAISPSASISDEISQSLKVTTTTQTVDTTEITSQETVQLPAGKRTVEARWCLVDRYELHRASDQSLLDSWEIPLPNTQVYDTK